MRYPLGAFRDSTATKTVGRSGPCPTPQPAKRLAFNARIFGALFAICHCRASLGETLSVEQKLRVTGDLLYLSPSIFLPASPAFCAESTYNAPQTLGEYPTVAYPPKHIASAAKRNDAAYHTRSNS